MRKVFTKVFAVIILGLVLSISSIYILSDKRISFAPGEPKSSERLDKNNLEDKTSNNETSSDKTPNDDQDKELEDSEKDINSNENIEPEENTETEEDTQLSVKFLLPEMFSLQAGWSHLLSKRGQNLSFQM